MCAARGAGGSGWSGGAPWRVGGAGGARRLGPRSTVRTAIRLGGTASERQREGEDEGGQQDRTGRDRVTRAASRGEEPTASCTATTGAADECDLIRKTLGRRSASKAVQVCVAASCSSPPEPLACAAGSPPSPALHRQVHILRRSWRTFSCAGVSVTFLYPPRGSNGPSTWQQPAAQCSELVAAGSSPPPRPCGCGLRAGAPDREK